MTSYVVVFGRTPLLGMRELLTFFPHASVLSPHVARLDSPTEERVLSVFESLGGSIKVAKVLDTQSSLTSVALTSHIEDGENVTFGLSSYDDVFQIRIETLREMKKILESKGVSARFVAPKSGNDLSSVVVTGQKIHEIIIVKEGDTFVIARTMKVQDFEAWNARDYGRPYADPRAGMLPPKVARMIVNIASVSKGTLLDPFCGMGTILCEALLTGWEAIGSDQLQGVIDKAQKNIEWLIQKYQIKSAKPKFFVSDATHISDHVDAQSVDAIVTEPFMGTGGRDIKNIIKGIEKLYIGCLRDWRKALKPHGRIVIAFPAYVVGDREIFVKKVIDMCENLGYTVEHGPIEYSRPLAIVRRKFYILRKNLLWHT